MRRFLRPRHSVVAGHRRSAGGASVPEPPVVVALGGNAIAPPGGRNSVEAQFERTGETAWQLVHLADRPLLVTHGNGPQVGTALLRSDLAAELVPTQPLDACVADTQGGMGYMLQQCLDNAFSAAGRRHPTVTVVTRTLVALDDPAFERPSKPIGGFYEQAEARRRMAADRWVMSEDAGRGWRRVVPSPEPVQIVEEAAIRSLLAAGVVVVAAGGGGVPVVRRPDSSLAGVEHVALDFGRPGQRDLHDVTAAELAGHAADGQFAPGSMLPKVRAALRFLERGGRRVVITTPELSEKAVAGEAGTQVTP